MKFEFKYNERQYKNISIVVILCLIVEVSFNKISSDIPNLINSWVGISIFTIISLICLFGFFYFYRITRSNSGASISSNQIPFIPKNPKVMGFVIYSLIVINLIILIQTFLGFYDILFLGASFLISYGASFVLFIIVAVKFLKWFTIKKSILFLLYGLAMIFIATSILAFSLYVEPRIIDKMVSYGTGGIFSGVVEYNSGLDLRSNFSSPHISSAITFNDELLEKSDPLIQTVGFMKKYVSNQSIDVYIFLLWISTIILLAHKIKKIGKTKYILIICLPLVYYIFTYDLFSSLNPKTGLGTIPDLIYDGLNDACDTCPPDLEAVIPSVLVEAYAMFIIGLFIYIGLDALSKTVPQTHSLKKYLSLASIGFLFYFINSEASIANTAFPPFGVVNTSFLIISTYLFTNGISFSAYIIANDHALRREIKESTVRTYKFMEEMGEAEDVLNLEKKVEAGLKTKYKFSNNEPLPYSISQNEISDYIQEVVREIQNDKKKIDM
jgi:hypothetical protein